MIRFIHTADNHLLDMQYGKKFRGADYAAAFMQVIDYAISQRIDFIIDSGDILDNKQPSESMLSTLFEAHVKLSEANIPFYAITGNHDASDPSFLTLTRFSKIQEGAGVVCIDNKTVIHKGLRIAGFPAVPWLAVHEAVEAAEIKPDIVVWHGAIKELMPFGCDLSIEDVWKTPFRLGCLAGDLHIHHQIRDAKGRLFSYPGSTELTKRDHIKEKFFDLYEIPPHADRLPDPLPIPLDTRPVLFLRCSSEQEISECVAKVRAETEKFADKPPMVFLSYNWTFRDVVPRVLACIDTTKTVFRYKALGSTNGSPGYEKIETAEELDAKTYRKPSLMDVVDKVIHPSSPLNALSRRLAASETDTRSTVVSFITARMEAIKAKSAQ